MSEATKSAANLIGRTPDRQRSRIGRIIDSLAKFGLDSSVDVSPKASAGRKSSTYGIVQERLRDHPSTSFSLKVKTKHEDSEAGTLMKFEAEQEEEKRTMSLQNETSSAICLPLARLKKAPTGERKVKDSALAETGKKRIFIRSRL